MDDKAKIAKIRDTLLKKVDQHLDKMTEIIGTGAEYQREAGKASALIDAVHLIDKIAAEDGE